MVITPFGRAVRQLQLEHGKQNSTVIAAALGVSPRILTQVELGRRPVPEDWPAKVQAFYHISASEYRNRLIQGGADGVIEKIPESTSKRKRTPARALLNQIMDEHQDNIDGLALKLRLSSAHIQSATRGELSEKSVQTLIGKIVEAYGLSETVQAQLERAFMLSTRYVTVDMKMVPMDARPLCVELCMAMPRLDARDISQLKGLIESLRFHMS